MKKQGYDVLTALGGLFIGEIWLPSGVPRS